METTTTSNKLQNRSSPDGYDLGQGSTDKEGFYGATPVTQPTGASQAVVVVVTDGTTGTTPAATNGIQPLTGTYNSTIIGNAIATLAQNNNALNTLLTRIRLDLVNLGLIKGS